MRVSYSMVRWHYPDISSTAPRQHGGYQNRLTPKEQHPLIRKVKSGVVNNASQLNRLLSLDLIIWVIKRISKKEMSKSVDKRKWPSLFYAQEALTWIHTVLVPTVTQTTDS